MTTRRGFSPRAIEGDDNPAHNGYTLTTVDGVPAWLPGGGVVLSIVEGTGISVDDTDPANPIVSATAGNVRLAVFKIAGTLTTGIGVTRLYNDTGTTWTLLSVRASVETAPSGGTVVIDVNKSGTTVFTTQANRPTIASAGSTSGKVTAIDVTSVPDGDYLTVDVDTNTVPAANLTVTIAYSS